MIFPDILRRSHRKANLVVNRARIPRFADAKTVHIADAHIRYHLRRRHGDGFDVGNRIDAVRAEPVVQPHGVRAGWKGLRKGVVALFCIDQFLQRFASGHALVLELIRERNRLAVVVDRHQHRHVFFRPADAHLHTVDQAI